MSALAAGMITTGELVSFLQASGIAVSIAGVGVFIVNGVKVLADELERCAKEVRPCIKCNHCDGFKYNIVSAGEKIANIASTFFGGEKDDSVAFRNCMCGHHINFHRGH